MAPSTSPGASSWPRLMLFVEPFQHAAGLLAGAARAVDGDVIAALLGHHAEPALDQREILSVLPEQDGGQPVVLEGEHDLRGGRFLGGGGGRDHGIRCAQVGSQAPAAARLGALHRLGERAEQRVAADLGDGDLHDRTDHARAAPSPAPPANMGSGRPVAQGACPAFPAALPECGRRRLRVESRAIGA